MSDRARLLLAGALVLALVVAGTGWVVQWQRASAADRRADELAAEVEDLRARLEGLRERLDAAERATEDEPRSRGGLVDDLFGGSGPLGDLLSGEVPGAACLSPAGGMLDGLLGGGEPLPDEPGELVDTVTAHVAELRELELQQDVEVDFVDGAQLSDRLESLLAEDTDRGNLEAERRLLSSLGAIPAGLDLAEVQRELLDAQVAGYYHPESGELVVRLPDDGRIRAIDRVTLAHELQHAVADQALGLPDLDDEPYVSDADALLGAVALIEGDATLLMQQWMLEHLSLTDQLAGMLGGDLAAAQASLDAVPHHLQRELLYPYTAGLDYVCGLYLDGGWEAVDAAYEQPPTTSHEVLFPTSHPVDPGVPAELTAPPSGSELLDTTFGAAPLLWLFEAPGGEPGRALDAPVDRAGAWAGGRVTVWDVDGETVTGLSLVDGDGSLCGSVAAWHGAAFPDHDVSGRREVRGFTGSDEAAALRCEGDAVRYAVADDADTAASVVDG
jgi:hypothetical protein